MAKTKPLRVGKVSIGGKRAAFILGPCVIESEKFVWRMARKIAEVCASEEVDFIFKASYDKANRTSVRSFRGTSVREGCDVLAAIGRELKIPVTTDVHSTAEAEIAGKKIDMCRVRTTGRSCASLNGEAVDCLRRSRSICMMQIGNCGYSS